MMMRQIHRRLAWIAGTVAVLWAATGFLHPIMSWTAPRPATQAPPAQSLSLDGVVAPGPFLAAQGIEAASSVRLVRSEGALVWLATAPGGARVAFNAQTGAPAPDSERMHAIALARHYAAAPNAEIASARRIDRFSTAYPSINRLLPVWEVRLATPGGLTLYVDTGADRLAGVANTLRRTLLFTFQNVHTLHFLEPVEPLRKALIFVLIAAVLAATTFGAAMALRATGRGRRGLHRWIGLAAAPFMLSFASSGLFHLFVSTPPAPIVAQTFQTAALTAPPRLAGAPFADLAASADADGAPIWRAQIGASGFYFNGNGVLQTLDDAARAQVIAQLGSDAAVTPITGFTREYGFAQKRLPVARVAHGSRVRFVSVAEGIMVAEAPAELARAEAWSFDTIHKWNFLNPIGRRNRDLAMMLAASLIAAAAVLGLSLRIVRRTSGVRS